MLELPTGIGGRPLFQAPPESAQGGGRLTHLGTGLGGQVEVTGDTLGEGVTMCNQSAWSS